jgi:hypothetical protein
MIIDLPLMIIDLPLMIIGLSLKIIGLLIFPFLFFNSSWFRIICFYLSRNPERQSFVFLSLHRTGQRPACKARKKEP